MNNKDKNDAPTVLVEKKINKNIEANLNESLKNQKTNNSNDCKLAKGKLSNDSFIIDNLLGKSSCQLTNGLILKPDLIIKENHYYFFPEITKSELEEEFKNNLDSYPYMFKFIREDLVEYSKKKQTEEFKKKIGFFNTLFREIHFLFNKEDQNKEIYYKTRKMAFFISQLNQVVPKSQKIVIFKKNEEKFDIDNDYFGNSPIIQSINENFNIDIKLITIDDNYINLLYEKMNELKNMIFNNYKNNNNNEMIVLINYLILKVNKILIDIENSYETQTLKNETKNILKNMRNDINYLTIKYNFEKVYNKKFFYDIEFEAITIIKNEENKKVAFIENGGNLDKFILLFKEEKDILNKKIIPVVDDDNNENTKEENIDFIKKCNSNIKKLIEIKNEKYENFTDMKKDNINSGIDSIKNISDKIKNNNININNNENKDANTILDRSCTAIDIGGDIIKGFNEIRVNKEKISNKKLSIENIDEQIKDWYKLKSIHQLLNDIDIKKKKNKNFYGLLIAQVKKEKKVENIFKVRVIY